MHNFKLDILWNLPIAINCYHCYTTATNKEHRNRLGCSRQAPSSRGKTWREVIKARRGIYGNMQGKKARMNTITGGWDKTLGPKD